MIWETFPIPNSKAVNPLLRRLVFCLENEALALTGKALVYGLNITDECVRWEDTRSLVEELADAVRRRRLKAEAEAEAE